MRRPPAAAPALCALALLIPFLRAQAQKPAAGVEVHYRLPTTGPLPKTYRVTLAAVDPKDPAWVVSTFASGVVRTVTAENQGKFAETWDGLDENFMPVPPGAYALKGIYMPAELWPIDGQYHTVIPKLVSMASSWGQSPSEDTFPQKVEGDSGAIDHGLTDVDIAPNGKGVVYFRYLENATNGFLTDFSRPIGYGQIITGYASGSVGGGLSACTDGKQIWLVCNVGHPFILHADKTPFGAGHAIGLSQGVYLPEGWVTDLTSWRDPQSGHSIVFVAERGKLVNPKPRHFDESAAGFVNEIVALDDADTARVLATWNIERPLAVKARGGRLYVLHGSAGKFEVSSLPLDARWRQAQFSPAFAVPAGINPFDMEIDSHGRIYLSDSAANHVYQFDPQGKPLRTYGRLGTQKGGTWDPSSFLAPEKLACWTDAHGRDRLLVIEMAGPNRLSEWSGDDGVMIRQWVVPQTEEAGYAVDPRHPGTVYMEGHRDTLVRWKIDYATGQWTTEAVWPHVSKDTFGAMLNSYPHQMGIPRLIYRGDDLYLAFRQGAAVYHFEGDRWRPCAALLCKIAPDRTRQYYLWSDRNGDGCIQEDEYIPYPVAALKSWFIGESWLGDLSLVGMAFKTPDAWRISPSRFDNRGTPIFEPAGCKKLLTDNVFVAKKDGAATAIRGGNELLTQGFDCSWVSAAESPSGDIYVNARAGYAFAANSGAQIKLSRYSPDGRGGYVQRWRVGRVAIQGNAKPGEVYGAYYVSPPVNGLVSVIDTWRAGVELYTEDGLYVDTLLPDSRAEPHDQMGAYWLPGEYFSGGYNYVNPGNGEVYFALGKTIPVIYEAQGWTAARNPVQPLTDLDPTVTLASNQISSPPDIAIQVRGGAAASRVARFYPAPGGGPVLDGAMTGWEPCDPVLFSSGSSQTIEARCFYDPGHLYIRWHARLGHTFDAKPLLLPEHIFAHEHGNDTLGLYLQGDSKAAPGAATPGGRPGDVRFVFGVFKDGPSTRPIVVGMYPRWPGSGASPITYTSAVGAAPFAHVGLVPGVNAGYKIDDDGQGFVLAASIPRAAIPGAGDPSGWHTRGNFDANLGGVDRFWWSNADGSADRNTYDEPTEARLYPGSWSPFEFLPVRPLPIRSWMAVGPFGTPALAKLDFGNPGDRLKIAGVMAASIFPPDTTRDLAAAYAAGDATVTHRSRHNLAWKDTELSADVVKLLPALGWDDRFRTALSPFNYDQGTIYLLTHVYSPAAAQVILRQLSVPHGTSNVTGQLDGHPLPVITEQGKTHLDSSKPVSLHAGWNELLLRSDVIAAESDLGAALDADSAILWKLKISAPVPSAPLIP